ncbi:MAG: hypothetical protein KDB65_13400 [Calditrichaeota bacterium]|nr:hypothetical protein [Calditrichota bacterium]
MSQSTRFAARTNVSSEQSRAEIERTLRRYGADGFSYGWDGNIALLMFKLNNRLIRFTLLLPNREEFRYTETRGIRRAEIDVDKAWEQASRQRWRALSLVIKAKLEAVESGITTAEDEFLAHIVLPDNTTLGQWAAPQIEAAYKTGQMPKLLPGG